MKNQKTLGRPRKISVEEKLAIVTQYYLTHEESLRDHGIFSRLSIYAKSLGYSLEARDFSRDPAVRDLLDKLISQLQKKKFYHDEKKTEISQPSYIPLDIPALINRDRKTIAASNCILVFTLSPSTK